MGSPRSFDHPPFGGNLSTVSSPAIRGQEGRSCQAGNSIHADRVPRSRASDYVVGENLSMDGGRR